MSFKSIVRELREMKDGIGNVSRRGSEGRRWRNRARAHIAPDQVPAPSDTPVEQSQWANLPSELLLDIIKRVEESETTWPARAVVVFCASVCKSWRDVTKETVRTPEQCGRLTFPISLKQPGPRENPIQCFIKRDRANSTYLLFCGLSPSEDERDKMLLAARKMRRATCTDFVISLVPDDFSRTSHNYMGKLKSNFLGTKFTIYDNNPPCESPMTQSNPRMPSSRRFHSKQSSNSSNGRRRMLLPPPCNYSIGTITYELNVLRTRGPRRMHCIMHSIPISSIQEGGTAPTPTIFPPIMEELEKDIVSKDKDLMNSTSSSLSQDLTPVQGLREPLVLKNKAPRWHEQLQCWCLNFRGRVTVASVKNFQLVAGVEPSHNVSSAEQDKVILQFGKIGKDIFTMDYRYPLSAVQAFAICLSSFDTKPACE